MPAFLSDLVLWSDRAEAARGIAGCLTDPDARRIMLGVADDYDELVRQEIGRLALALCPRQSRH
jgi:hypothetical protein